MTIQAIPTTYIPLEKFHIVPLTGLAPEQLKISAKRTSRDREKIAHTTKLNAIVNRLGIKGGFASYEREYREALLPFMESNNLIKRKDLLKHTKSGSYNLYFPFSRQDVSERLFYYEGSIPSKIFTGHNFDFSGVLSWHNLDLHDVLEEDDDWRQIILGDYHVRRMVEDTFDINTLPERQQQLLNLDVGTEITLQSIDSTGLPSLFDLTNHEVELKFAQKDKKTRYKSISVKIVDLILLKNRNGSSSIYHLLGNALTDTPLITSHIKLYASNAVSKDIIDRDLNSDRYLQKLLTERLSQSSVGWVKVLPYNESLIFLADEKGNYDFVIRNQRGRIFNHELFGNNLKRADIPSFLEDYRFLRWYYFEYEGNRDLDMHYSEQHYYKNGGTAPNYPGTEVILRQYYQDKGRYHPQHRTSAAHLDGFKQVIVGEKLMMVSELITISELIKFLKINSDYSSSRQGDQLAQVNNERDIDLPASCTFFDVLAYVNWFEKETGVPLRLLSYNEYLSLRENQSSLKSALDRRSDMVFVDGEGKAYSSHPPYMSSIDFDNLHLCYQQPLDSFKVNGLSFIESNFFCEWLLEGVQIRSASLPSFYMDDYVLRTCGPKDSTGKYKGMKTGFRLCYEVSQH